MNVNQKGFVGLTRTVAHLAELGYEVFLPAQDFSAADLVVINEQGMVKRLQVKYRAAKNGVVFIPLHTVVNGKKVPIDRNRIDGWAVYVPVYEMILYVPVAVAEHYASAFSVRVEAAKIATSSVHCTEFINPAKLWS